jgi:uncharacterized tellurite resistance protein B-like protein
MILDQIRSLISSRKDAAPTASPDPEVDPLHLAACALLLEVAHADGEFTAPERTHLEAVLERHFGLEPEAGRRLIEIADAERRKSIDHFHFTSMLQKHYDLGQKMVLAEVMWGLVLADGKIAEHEQYLTRKIANLLELEPGYLSAAKAAAATQRTPQKGAEGS